MSDPNDYRDYCPIEEAEQRERECDCMNCGTCHDCIILTMEASHEAELADLRSRLASAESDRDALRAHLDEAEGLLRPFAEYCEAIGPAFTGKEGVRIQYGESMQAARKCPKVDDLRRAASFLSRSHETVKETQ